MNARFDLWMCQCLINLRRSTLWALGHCFVFLCFCAICVMVPATAAYLLKVMHCCPI